MPGTDPFSALLARFPPTGEEPCVVVDAADFQEARTLLQGLLAGIDLDIQDAPPWIADVAAALKGGREPLQLQDITLYLSPGERSVTSVGLRLGLELGPVASPAFGGAFTLSSASLYVILFNPDDYPAGWERWDAWVEADTSVFGITFEVHISVRHRIAVLKSRPGNAGAPLPSAQQLLAGSLGYTNDSLVRLFSGHPTLPASTNFSVQVDLSGGVFFATLMIDEPATWNKLALRQISVALSRFGGLSFSISAVAAIGGVGTAVALSDDAGGLAMTAEALPDVALPVGRFIESLAGQLGLSPQSPAFPFDLDLTRVAFTITETGGALSSFSADCAAVLLLEETGTSVEFSLAIEKAGGELQLALTLGGLMLEAQSGGGALAVFSANLGSNASLSLEALAKFLRLKPLAQSPLAIDLAVKKLFLAAKPGTTPAPHLFGLQLGFDARLDDQVLGLVTAGAGIAVPDAAFLAASAPWAPADLAALSGCLGGFQFPAQVRRGPSGTARVSVGTRASFVPLQPSGQGASSAPPTEAPGGQPTAVPVPVASASATRWFDVQRQVGPIYLDRLGFSLAGEDAFLLSCDAAMTLGPLGLVLEDFTCRLPLSWDFTPSRIDFALQGLSLSYDKPPLSISGGFLRGKDKAGDAIYAGDAVIQTETLLLSAEGEYAKLAGGGVSLALFAALNDPPLGGPVFCFVTGLAAGFGYNSRLSMPDSPAAVAGFPLLNAALPGAAPVKPMAMIAACATPESGEDWLALGLLFRSFELAQSTVILTVGFGQQLQFAILGRSEISLPPAPTPAHPERLAYAQIDVAATYAPGRALQVFGALDSSSFVLSQQCRLSGGFAYIMDESGDFVMTLGGYAPGYDYAAAGYPAVPRLSLQWQVDSHTDISASAYFALTPAVMMTGGNLQAAWSSGIFSAWFNAEADLFMKWRPFHYDGDFSMCLGVSFDLRILFVHVHFTFQVGASLQVAGPPFHGTAHIDLSVISFTVSFGPSSPRQNQLSWTEFRAMLPGNPVNDAADSDLLSIRVTAGVLKAGTKENPLWIVNGTNFHFKVLSSIPVTDAGASQTSSVTLTPAPTAIGILPMGAPSVRGCLSASILAGGQGAPIPTGADPTSPIVAEPLETSVPPAHWGTSDPTGVNDQPLQATSGYALRGGRPNPHRTVPVLVSTLLSEPAAIQAVASRPPSENPFAS